MKNKVFTIDIDQHNGTIKSLVLNDDPAKMNWVEGMANWGEPVGFECVDMFFDGNEIRSCYRQGTLELEVIRTLWDDRLTEKFVYRNTGYYDLYFNRGDLGIYATFNDSYPSSDICISQRCH
ncbi:MAG: hypothetical protein IKX48_17430, partial [Victivallales bacterium]|nr:hypothetical protein [Victivallales bacterium]